MSSSSATQSVDSIYRDHQGWLRSWLMKKLGCSERAADLSQDTFVRMLTSPRTGVIEKPRSFLAKVATRLIIDQSRRDRLERIWLKEHGEIAAEQALAPSSQDLVEMINTLERIAAMLDGLAEKPRKAFLMYRLDGMAQSDIADELGVSTSMVKKYVAQGLLHCHRALSPEQTHSSARTNSALVRN